MQFVTIRESPPLHFLFYLLEYCLLPALLWITTYTPKLGDRREKFYKNGFEFILIQSVSNFSIFIRIIADNSGITILSTLPFITSLCLVGIWLFYKSYGLKRFGEINTFLTTFMSAYCGGVVAIAMLAHHAHIFSWTVVVSSSLVDYPIPLTKILLSGCIVVLLCWMTIVYIRLLTKAYRTFSFMIAEARRLNNQGSLNASIKLCDELINVSGRMDDAAHRNALNEGTFILAQVLRKKGMLIESKARICQLIEARRLGRRNLGIYFQFLIDLNILIGSQDDITEAKSLAKAQFEGQELDEILIAIEHKRPLFDCN